MWIISANSGPIDTIQAAKSFYTIVNSATVAPQSTSRLWVRGREGTLRWTINLHLTPPKLLVQNKIGADRIANYFCLVPIAEGGEWFQPKASIERHLQLLTVFRPLECLAGEAEGQLGVWYGVVTFAVSVRLWDHSISCNEVVWKCLWMWLWFGSFDEYILQCTSWQSCWFIWVLWTVFGALVILLGVSTTLPLNNHFRMHFGSWGFWWRLETMIVEIANTSSMG